jgi:hypothetical protein
MARNKVGELQKKKEELEDELSSIQKELDGTFSQVRHDMNNKLDPRSFIREHPFSSVGGAALLGLLFGKKKKNRNNHVPPSNDGQNAKSHSSDSFSSILMKELGKLVTKKAIALAGFYLDQKLKETQGDSAQEENL